MKMVLDTGALYHAPLLRVLAEARQREVVPAAIEPVLPAIAHGERLRQLRRDGRPEAPWREHLEMAGVRIEPFDQHIAQRLAERDIPEHHWRKHARDYLIAAHAAGDCVAVTPDKGPAWSGLRVLPPEAATDFVRALLA